MPYILSQYSDFPSNVNVKYDVSYPKGCNIHIEIKKYHGIYFNKHESGSPHPGNLQVCTLIPEGTQFKSF